MERNCLRVVGDVIHGDKDLFVTTGQFWHKTHQIQNSNGTPMIGRGMSGAGAGFFRTVH